ncbi:MAG: hypothetical protein LBT26_00115 [Clostridiales Family XIII bacterium]|jgi:hypothetical protein|nr:hypothetical protein [Clostridiales Family XIII bacterium]
MAAHGTVVARDALRPEQIRAMFAIMQKYYENIQWESFVSDLDAKRDVILLRDADEVIRGFTTLAVYAAGGAQLLFSGDTIVEQNYWGANDLIRAWLNNALVHVGKHAGDTYWLLLSKGYKTYKYLPVFLRAFYPCADAETPDFEQSLMDAFCRERYGEKYQGGVVKAGKDFLKAEIASIGAAHRKDRHTQFFLAKNPGYAKGDELVCLAKLSADNLNRAGRRMLGK